MARNAHTTARDFATYAVETIRRDLSDTRTLIAARELYFPKSTYAGVDDIIRKIFAGTTVEVDSDGEIFFRLPKPKRSHR